MKPNDGLIPTKEVHGVGELLRWAPSRTVFCFDSKQERLRDNRKEGKIKPESLHVMNMLRIQLDLPAKRVEELNSLMQESHITTRKDFFNTALTLFAWVVGERGKGRVIASLDEKTGGYKELVMPFFSFKKDEEDGNNNNQGRNNKIFENLAHGGRPAIKSGRKEGIEQKAKGKTAGGIKAASSIKGQR